MSSCHNPRALNSPSTSSPATRSPLPAKPSLANNRHARQPRDHISKNDASEERIKDITAVLYDKLDLGFHPADKTLRRHYPLERDLWNGERRCTQGFRVPSKLEERQGKHAARTPNAGRVDAEDLAGRPHSSIDRSVKEPHQGAIVAAYIHLHGSEPAN